MPADTVTAQDGPELRPHPRVTAFQRQLMAAGVDAFAKATRQLREPVTSTHAAYKAASHLAHFAHVLGGQIAAPAEDGRTRARWTVATATAFSSLTFCAELVPDQSLDTARCEPTRAEILDWAGDVEAYAHRHPYRMFLFWWMVSVSAATRYAVAAHDVTQHQASDRACVALRMANVNAPQPVPDLSDGYLDANDLAALCFTTTDRIGVWSTVGDFPAPDFRPDHDRPRPATPGLVARRARPRDPRLVAAPRRTSGSRAPHADARPPDRGPLAHPGPLNLHLPANRRDRHCPPPTT